MKKPFGSPQTVLDYFGRYNCRVALSNDRILDIENGQITLSYRDRKDGDRKQTMTVDAHEFIRRFLLHVVPYGFMRIRHFGFLANRSKKLALARCRCYCPPFVSTPETISPKNYRQRQRSGLGFVGALTLFQDLPTIGF